MTALLNKRLTDIKAGPQRAFLEKAKNTRGAVLLTASEPDFGISDGVRIHLSKSIEHGKTHYASPEGDYFVRRAIVDYETRVTGAVYSTDEVIVTVGASEGLYLAFQTILNPGDEVIIPMPAVSLYETDVRLAGGVPVFLDTSGDGFQINAEKLNALVTDKTKAILINSPNNPSGVIYSKDELKALAAILQKATEKYGRPIFLISDEPYRFLAFDGAVVPSVLPLYTYSVVIGSFSKNLALAGERVGYVAINPTMENVQSLISGVIMTNRILGFVNAPCIGQRLMKAALGTNADATEYVKRRKLMADVLTDAGLKFTMPAGTFYFFPQAPNGMDDVKFVSMLADEKILVVPGSGFGYPGYFRIALCGDTKFIERSRAGFKAAVKKALAK